MEIMNGKQNFDWLEEIAREDGIAESLANPNYFTTKIKGNTVQVRHEYPVPVKMRMIALAGAEVAKKEKAGEFKGLAGKKIDGKRWQLWSDQNRVNASELCLLSQPKDRAEQAKNEEMVIAYASLATVARFYIGGECLIYASEPARLAFMKVYLDERERIDAEMEEFEQKQKSRQAINPTKGAQEVGRSNPERSNISEGE